jgi:transcriptional regulator with XRE-family HTH domain
VLRLERLSLRIDQKAFAKALGMSRQRLDELEKRERLTDEFIERYRGTLRTVMTIAPDASDSGEG